MVWVTLDPRSSSAPPSSCGQQPARDMAAAGYDVYVYCVGEVSSRHAHVPLLIGSSGITVSSDRSFADDVHRVRAGSGGRIGKLYRLPQRDGKRVHADRLAGSGEPSRGRP